MSIAQFRRSDSGNIATLFALMLPVMIGFTGLGAEAGYWYYKNRQLQAAADVAAYSGAIELHRGSTRAAVENAAKAAAQSNGFDPSRGTIEINNPPASGEFRDALSVEVKLTHTLPRYFSSIFVEGDVKSAARAVAKTSTQVNTACVLATSPSATRAVSLSGNTQVASGDCNVAANSNAPDAIYMTGRATLAAPCVLSVGGVSATSGLTLSLCKTPTTGVKPLADPYESVPAPSATGPCTSAPAAATVLYPGRYCGGLDIKSSISFAPGIYVISGGDLKISANANVTGNGVTFYFSGNSSVSISANSGVDLKAANSGTYSGILFFGDRNATSGSPTFGGGSSSTLTGALYFPAQTVSYSGGSGQSGGCTQIVARTISFSGSAQFTSVCPGTGIKPVATADASALTRLVE